MGGWARFPSMTNSDRKRRSGADRAGSSGNWGGAKLCGVPRPRISISFLVECWRFAKSRGWGEKLLAGVRGDHMRNHLALEPALCPTNSQQAEFLAHPPGNCSVQVAAASTPGRISRVTLLAGCARTESDLILNGTLNQTCEARGDSFVRPRYLRCIPVSGLTLAFQIPESKTPSTRNND